MSSFTFHAKLLIEPQNRYDIVQGVVKDHGDRRISQPNFDWHLGRLYVRTNSPQLQLTWSMLSQALQGILDFWPVITEFQIIHDTQGFVATGSVGYGYNAIGNITAVD